MTPDGESLLRSVLASPDDDAPRLIYADWLDENGQGGRAEFIRMQIQAFRLRGGGCAAVPGSACDGHRVACPRCRLIARALDMHNASDWLPLVCVGERAWTVNEDEPLEPYGGGARFAWSRGWVAGVALPAADWLAHADALLAVHPVREVVLTDWPEAEQVERVARLTFRLRGRAKVIHWRDVSTIQEVRDYPGRSDLSLGTVVHRIVAPHLLAAEWPAVRFRLPAVPAGN